MGQPGPGLIRLAQPDELPLVYAIMLAGFAPYRSMPHPSSALTETLQDVEQAAARGGALLAFTADGTPIASGRFSVQWPDHTGPLTPQHHQWITEAATGAPVSRPPGGALDFSRLAVLPDHTRQGFGCALIDWLEALAQRLQLTELTCTARSQQPDNRPWYTAMGFEIEGYSGRYGIPDIRTHLSKRLCRL